MGRAVETMIRKSGDLHNTIPSWRRTNEEGMRLSVNTGCDYFVIVLFCFGKVKRKVVLWKEKKW